MEVTTPRSARQVAGELRDIREIRRAHEVCELDLVAELVDLYDTIPDSMVEGAERLVPSGHAGTALFAEFLIAELAPILKLSVHQSRALVSDVMDLRDRLPRTWEALHRGLLQVWEGRKIAQATGGLSLEACLKVDEALFPVLGCLPWPRVRRKLGALILEADPEGAEKAAAFKRDEQYLRVTHEPGGMSTLTARLKSENALIFVNAIESIAKNKVEDGYKGSMVDARVDALVDLVLPSDSPGGLPRPEATIVVHVTPGSHLARTELIGAQAARGGGELGAMLLPQVRDLLQHHRVRVLPVVDLNDDPSADAYEVPAGIRRFVDVRDSFEVFPYSSTPAWGCDKDHTKEWPAGETRASNLGPLSRFIHRAKTHTNWQYEQTSPGEFHLTSPLGFEYHLTRGGTAQAGMTWHVPARRIEVNIDYTPRPRPKAS